MPEIARLIGGTDCFELEFVERDATPEPTMKLGICLHAGADYCYRMSSLT